MSPTGKESLESFLKKLGQASAPKSRVQGLFSDAASAAGKGNYEQADKLSGQAGQLTRTSRVIERVTPNLVGFLQNALEQEGLSDFDFPALRILAPGEIAPEQVKVKPVRVRRSKEIIRAEQEAEAKKITPLKILEDPITEIVLGGRLDRDAVALTTLPSFNKLGYAEPTSLRGIVTASLEQVALSRGNKPVTAEQSKDAINSSGRAINRMYQDLRGWDKLKSEANKGHISWGILYRAFGNASSQEEKIQIRDILTRDLQYQGDWENPCGNKVSK